MLVALMLLLLHAAAIQPFATDTAQILRNASSRVVLVMTFHQQHGDLGHHVASH